MIASDNSPLTATATAAEVADADTASAPRRGHSRPPAFELCFRREHEWTPILSTPIAKLAADQVRAQAYLAMAKSELLRAINLDGGDVSIEARLELPSYTADGFGICLHVGGTAIFGSFGGLEQEFDALDEAMAWVKRGLCESYRLRVSSCRGRPFRWQLEPSPGASSDGPKLCGGRFLSFERWRHLEVQFRHNRILDLRHSRVRAKSVDVSI